MVASASLVKAIDSHIALQKLEERSFHFDSRCGALVRVKSALQSVAWRSAFYSIWEHSFDALTLLVLDEHGRLHVVGLLLPADLYDFASCTGLATDTTAHGPHLHLPGQQVSGRRRIHRRIVVLIVVTRLTGQGRSIGCLQSRAGTVFAPQVRDHAAAVNSLIAIVTSSVEVRLRCLNSAPIGVLYLN